jgi:predicted RecA/RadA family phage recombinase
MQNFIQPGDTINVACTHPTTPASGNPVRIGTFCGVAVTDESAGGNATGETTVLTEGVVNVSVKGVNGSGNSAVAVGDKIYYTDADTPVLAKKSTGTLFGYALSTVGSGSTATIAVLLAN